MSFIKTMFRGSSSAKIYKDGDTQEYVVKFYKDAKHLPNADHFTSDLDDATGTASLEMERMENFG